MRFILVGDLLDAWAAFGGLSAQLSHLSIFLHLSAVSNETLSIMYDSEVRAQIHQLSRLRGEDADFERLLTEGNAEIKPRLKGDWERELMRERRLTRVLRGTKG